MKLIIFDIDGTLCYSDNVDDWCYSKAFEDVTSFAIENRDWDSYKCPTEPGIFEQLYIEHFGRNPFKEEIRTFLNRYMDLLKIEFEKNSFCFREVPGAKILLTHLVKNKETKVGIATGGFGETAMLKLTRLGFDLKSIPVHHSDDHKLKSDIILDLIGKLKGNFEKIIYIGDREYDYKASREINIDFIGVDYERNGRLKSLGIRKIVNDFESVEGFLKFLN